MDIGSSPTCSHSRIKHPISLSHPQPFYHHCPITMQPKRSISHVLKSVSAGGSNCKPVVLAVKQCEISPKHGTHAKQGGYFYICMARMFLQFEINPNPKRLYSQTTSVLKPHTCFCGISSGIWCSCNLKHRYLIV